MDILGWIRYFGIRRHTVDLLDEHGVREKEFPLAILVNPLYLPCLQVLDIDLRKLKLDHCKMISLGIELYNVPICLSVFIDIMLDISEFNHITFLSLIDELTLEVGPLTPLNAPGFLESLINLKNLRITGECSSQPWLSELNTDRFMTLGCMKHITLLDITGCQDKFENYDWFPYCTTILKCRHEFITCLKEVSNMSRFLQVQELYLHCHNGAVDPFSIQFSNLQFLKITQYNYQDRFSITWFANFMESLVNLTSLEIDWLSVSNIQSCYHMLNRLEKLSVLHPILTQENERIVKPVKEHEVPTLPCNRLIEKCGNLSQFECRLGPHELISYPVLKDMTLKSPALKKLQIFCSWPRISESYYDSYLELAEFDRRQRHPPIRKAPIPIQTQGFNYLLPFDMNSEDLIESIFIGLDQSRNMFKNIPEHLFCFFAAESSSISKNEHTHLSSEGYQIEELDHLTNSNFKLEGIVTIDVTALRSLLAQSRSNRLGGIR